VEQELIAPLLTCLSGVRVVHVIKLYRHTYGYKLCYSTRRLVHKFDRGSIHGLLKKNKRTLALSFNFTISYIDDVLSLYHSKFGYFVLSDLYLNVHSGISNQLRDIYCIYRCSLNVATYIWKVHNGNIKIISFVLNLRS
jgi:hypothetical protein